jgi:delta 1-pyrroline-5-carboxylate dehydrogenase
MSKFQDAVCRCSARIRVQHDLALRRSNNLRGAGRVIRSSQNKNLRTDWGAVVKIGNVIIGQSSRMNRFGR